MILRALSDSEDSHTGSIAHLSSTKAFAEGAGALALVEPPYRETPGSKPLRGFKAIYTHLMKGDKVLRQTFFAIPLYNLCTFHVAWLVQTCWEEQGLLLLVFGALWFAQSLTMGVARQYGHYLEKTRGPVFALFLIGLLPIIGHFGMVWWQGWMGIAVCFILFFCRGLYRVIMVNALNRRVPGNVRATVKVLKQEK